MSKPNMTKPQRAYLLGLLEGLRGHATSRVQMNCDNLGWSQIVCTEERGLHSVVTPEGMKALGL